MYVGAATGEFIGVLARRVLCESPETDQEATGLVIISRGAREPGPIDTGRGAGCISSHRARMHDDSIRERRVDEAVNRSDADESRPCGAPRTGLLNLMRANESVDGGAGVFRTLPGERCETRRLRASAARGARRRQLIASRSGRGSTGAETTTEQRRRRRASVVAPVAHQPDEESVQLGVLVQFCSASRRVGAVFGVTAFRGVARLTPASTPFVRFASHGLRPAVERTGDECPRLVASFLSLVSSFGPSSTNPTAEHVREGSERLGERCRQQDGQG